MLQFLFLHLYHLKKTTAKCAMRKKGSCGPIVTWLIFIETTKEIDEHRCKGLWQTGQPTAGRRNEWFTMQKRSFLTKKTSNTFNSHLEWTQKFLDHSTRTPWEEFVFKIDWFQTSDLQLLTHCVPSFLNLAHCLLSTEDAGEEKRNGWIKV